MSGSVISTAIDRARALWWWKVRIGVMEWIRTRPSRPCVDAEVDMREHVNTLFDPRFVDHIPDTVRRVRHFDPWLRAHLAIAGRLRAWEYGVFLKAVPELAGKVLLDAGVGASTFCAYCAACGARVVALDLPSPFEERRATQERVLRRYGVRKLNGSVTALPLADASIDIVICVSVLEHLGESQTRNALPGQAERVHLFERTVAEFSRVLKPGGCVYLTFEVCDRKLQTTDGWAGTPHVGEVWGAFDLEFIGPEMLQLLKVVGLTLEPRAHLDPRLLHADHTRQNYRGRYISTVCLLAKKVSG